MCLCQTFVCTQVDSDIFYSTRAALMGLFGGHALLMAFALKLRVGAALRQAHSGGVAKGKLKSLPASSWFVGGRNVCGRD